MKNCNRFGHAKYAQILALAVHGGTTVSKVMAAMKTQIQTAREILWKMERLGLIRVAEWRDPETRSSFLVPVFVADGGESLPYPRHLTRRAIGGTSSRPRSELAAFAHMVRCLRVGMTRQEIHEETGVAYMRVGNVVREMRRLKIVHVSDWREREGGMGRPAEVLSFGVDRDEPRPKRMTRAEIQRRCRQKRAARESMLTIIRATAGVANEPRITEAA